MLLELDEICFSQSIRQSMSCQQVKLLSQDGPKVRSVSVKRQPHMRPMNDNDNMTTRQKVTKLEATALTASGMCTHSMVLVGI